MSKYYKAEDVIRAIAERLCWETRTEYGDKFTTEDWLEEAEDYVLDLPTIEVSDKAVRPFEYLEGYEDGRKSVEVSEDCISREWVVNRFKDIVEHYEMRIRRAKRYGKKTTYDTSEQIGYWKDEIADYKYFIREIENAPSVVPKPKEGEWQLVDHLWECDCCQYRQNKSKPTNYCPNCGAKMKGAEEE